MFESSFTFTQVSSGTVLEEYPLIKQAVYAFKTNKGKRYVVLIHEYDYKVFVIKFYDSRFKNAANRYSMILNDFECTKVLKTVIQIAQLTLEKEPFASFAFVGVYKEGKETKKTEKTQRPESTSDCQKY